MKKSVVLALIVGFVLTGALAADERHVRVKLVELGDDGSAGTDDTQVEIRAQRKIELKLDGDGDATVFEADDIEIGESRQFFTESGKEVLLTRTEEGMEIEVDGKKIDLGGLGSFMSGGDHGEGSGHMHKQVFVHRMGDECEEGEGQHCEDHEAVFIGGNDGTPDGAHRVVMIDGSEMEWVGEDGGKAFHMTIERQGAAARLIESGVLDEVDDDIRERILDVLDEGDEVKIIRQKMVEVEKENG